MQYAVFGQPVQHSRSPQIHHLFAQEEGIDLHYGKIAPEISEFEAAVLAFQAAGGLGANVTVPFKERAYALADTLTDRARAAGAVNTLIFKTLDNGQLEIQGDNTDGAGLMWDITKRLAVDLSDKRVLIIGAGGAVKGILLPLLEQQPSEVVIVNRTMSKAQALAQQFNVTAMSAEALVNELFDVVINASASGLSLALPDVPASIFHQAQLAYDLVYGEHAQHFLQWAKDNGALQTADGLGMLVGQAAQSYYQWRGFQAAIAPVMEVLLKNPSHV